MHSDGIEILMGAWGRMFQAGSSGNADEDIWLPGARLNIAESCFEGRDPDAPALVWADEASPRAIHTTSLGSLRLQSFHVAASLQQLGIRPGTMCILINTSDSEAISERYLAVQDAMSTSSLIFCFVSL